jgi:hypothetical protein
MLKIGAAGYKHAHLLNEINLSTKEKPCTVQPRSARVNQHAPVDREGWMASGQETVFCWVHSSFPQKIKQRFVHHKGCLQ